jgi:hypothetical protein
MPEAVAQFRNARLLAGSHALQPASGLFFPRGIFLTEPEQECGNLASITFGQLRELLLQTK